ncbi:hypothetical protein L6Q96_02700 [Candidatus Binatia bacterium]|nr:hypothetical protein [Candidatus Binatia bacterium]
MKGRFAVRFLLAFTCLVVFWWLVDLGDLYRTAALTAAQALSPLVNGWWLEFDRPGLADPVVYRRGNEQLPMLLQLPALSMALMPFLSLVAATPGLGWHRGLVAAGVGSLLFFAIHVIIVLIYPLVMSHPNFVKDTIGVFSGMVAFVVAPLALWFALTYPALRNLWQLSPIARAGLRRERA